MPDLFADYIVARKEVIVPMMVNPRCKVDAGHASADAARYPDTAAENQMCR